MSMETHAMLMTPWYECSCCKQLGMLSVTEQTGSDKLRQAQLPAQLPAELEPYWAGMNR